jgi:hypothetical protein
MKFTKYAFTETFFGKYLPSNIMFALAKRDEVEAIFVAQLRKKRNKGIEGGVVRTQKIQSCGIGSYAVFASTGRPEGEKLYSCSSKHMIFCLMRYGNIL